MTVGRDGLRRDIPIGLCVCLGRTGRIGRDEDADRANGIGMDCYRHSLYCYLAYTLFLGIV